MFFEKNTTPQSSLFRLCFILSVLFLSIQSEQEPTHVIVHMNGNLYGGLDYLNLAIVAPTQNNASIQSTDTGRTKRTKLHKYYYNRNLNPDKSFFKEDDLSEQNSTAVMIYTNNLPINQMDLGGPRCVQFFKEMILHAHKTYPNAKLILAGASQGSVGPFGALVELAKENHTTLGKISHVLIESVLGSTHETINSQVPFIAQISPKILPLLAEYIPGFIQPGFAYYDAFAPQLVNFAEQLNTNATSHIKYVLVHDQQDPIIPVSCAHTVVATLQKHNPKNVLYLEKTTGSHLPLDQGWTSFILGNYIFGSQKANSNAITTDQKTQTRIIETANWFVNRTPLQRFFIRRLRDLTCILIVSLPVFFAIFMLQLHGL